MKVFSHSPLSGGFAADKVALSVLVPVYNEAQVLPLFFQRLWAVVSKLEQRCELVFVDDGSSDASAAVVTAFACSYPFIKLVRLSRNFGKEAAMSAGLDYCTGAAIIILDADLQDPPELIPQMVKAWQAGADVVAMRRRSRGGEAWHKRLSAHLFYRVLNHLSEVSIPEDTGDFRLMSARAVHALRQMPERARYMKGIFAWVGYPTTVLLYDREPRAAGKTKWSYGKLVGLALEGITSFSTRPLRWASGIGLVVAVLGLVYGLFIVAKALLFGDAAQGFPSLIAVIAFLGGVQLITMGILGQYVGKTYMESKNRPLYLVQEVLQSSASLNAASARPGRQHAAV